MKKCGSTLDSFYEVVVIGGGISGIAAGCQLKRKLHLNNFKIFERSDGIGVRSISTLFAIFQRGANIGI
jgi:protoporphyrinogen oxidase